MPGAPDEPGALTRCPGVVAAVGEPGVALVPGCVVVVVPAVCAQVGDVKTSVSNVTAALRASARPWTVTPVVTVIDDSARMLPRKIELVPSVAELPTCQNTLHSCAPLIRVTVLLDAVINVELV